MAINVLIVEKLRDPDERLFLSLVSGDESGLDQLRQPLSDINLVLGKNQVLDLAWPVFEASFAVGEAPQADE